MYFFVIWMNRSYCAAEFLLTLIAVLDISHLVHKHSRQWTVRKGYLVPVHAVTAGCGRGTTKRRVYGEWYFLLHRKAPLLGQPWGPYEAFYVQASTLNTAIFRETSSCERAECPPASVIYTCTHVTLQAKALWGLKTTGSLHVFAVSRTHMYQSSLSHLPPGSCTDAGVGEACVGSARRGMAILLSGLWHRSWSAHLPFGHHDSSWPP